MPQTNLQLYGMLLRRDWDGVRLERMKRAYDLAVGLFTAQFRPSDKPFVCHLVGTAGVAASMSDRVDVAAAALLHAAYDYGDWGDGRSGQPESRRGAVRLAIGEDAERLVSRYCTLGWDRAVVERIRSMNGEVSELDRAVVLIRLANEVDDMADLGLCLSSKGDEPLHQAEAIEAMAALGRSLGFDDLADLLLKVFGENCAAAPPPTLRVVVAASRTVLPRSVPRGRLPMVLRRWAAKSVTG